MKADKYRFSAYTSSRGECQRCKQRRTGVLIRLRVPVHKDLRICYECLLGDLAPDSPLVQSREAAQKRIGDYKQELKERKVSHEKLKKAGIPSISNFTHLSKIEREIKEKKNGNGLLSPVLADVEGAAATPAKENG